MEREYLSTPGSARVLPGKSCQIPISFPLPSPAKRPEPTFLSPEVQASVPRQAHPASSYVASALMMGHTGDSKAPLPSGPASHRLLLSSLTCLLPTSGPLNMLLPLLEGSVLSPLPPLLDESYSCFKSQHGCHHREPPQHPRRAQASVPGPLPHLGGPPSGCDDRCWSASPSRP